MHDTPESDRVIFWLTVYTALATSLFVFAVAARFMT